MDKGESERPSSARVVNASRRRLLQSAALAGAVQWVPASAAEDVSGRVAPSPSGAPSFSVRLFRKRDGLDLHAHFFNIRLTSGILGLGGPCLRASFPGASDPRLSPKIVFELAPQHVGEEAILRGADCTSNSYVLRDLLRVRLARPTFIAFDIPERLLPMRYALDDLLKWERFRPLFGPESRPFDQIRPLGPLETVIGLYRLSLSPTSDVSDPASGLHWSVNEFAVHRSEHELWHARLRDSRFDPDPLRANGVELAAAWSPDFGQVKPDSPGTELEKPFRMSLNRLNRHQIVLLSHAREFCPEPLFARRLIVSSRGLWARLEKYWPWTSERATVALTRYDHVVSEGRDEDVEVVERGFLYPLGHKAVLIRKTRRKVARFTRPDGRSTFYAYPEQKFFIELIDEALEYGSPVMPFPKIEFKQKRTPALDDPMLEANSVPRSVAGAKTWGDNAFWPHVCGQVHKFELEGTDHAGNPVTLPRELIFIKDIDPSCCPPGPDGDNCRKQAGSVSLSAMVKDAGTDFLARFGSGMSPTSGQKAALARTIQRGDTEVELHYVRFDGELLPDASCSASGCTVTERFAPFLPRVVDVECQVPAIKNLCSNGGGQAVFELIDPDGAGNDAEIFAKLKAGQVNTNFHKDTSDSAAVASVNPSINALSRRFGPTASSLARINTERGLRAQFDPETLFAGDAKLFNSVPLGKIVSAALIDVAGSVPQILNIVSELADAPDVTQSKLDWETDALRPWPADTPIFLPAQGCRMVAKVEAAAWRFGAEPPSVIALGRLENFAIQLGISIGGNFNGIAVAFNSFEFYSVNGQRPDVKVDIKPDGIQFKGAALEFVKSIQEKLGFLGGRENKFKVDLSRDGVAIFPPPVVIPDLNIGAFSVTNLNIYSACKLPFTQGRPLSFEFSLARPDNKFQVTAGIYAGGGYVAMEVNAEKVRSFDLCIEFGAAKQLKLGGVVNGRAEILGGFSYSSRSELVPVENVKVWRSTVLLTAYVRASGSFSWWVITLSLELYVGMSARFGAMGESVVDGTARLTISAKVGFVRKSHTISYTQRFSGSGGATRIDSVSVRKLRLIEQAAVAEDSLFADSIRFEDWKRYEEAFYAGPALNS